MWNFVAQLALPLLGEVRRAEHGEALDLAAVEQLAGDQRGLDRLADADVVGDQQPHRVELERHQQRHELVGARLDGDPAEASGTGRRDERKPEPQRVAQQARAARRRRPAPGRAARTSPASTGSSSGRIPVISSSVPPSGRRTSRSGCRTRAGRPTRGRGRDERADGVAHVPSRSAPVRRRRSGSGRGSAVQSSAWWKRIDLAAGVVQARVGVARRRAGWSGSSWIGPSTKTATWSLA